MILKNDATFQQLKTKQGTNITDTHLSQLDFLFVGGGAVDMRNLTVMN